MKKINSHELHALLLDLAITFDRICKNNKIPYYMLGGTMLGAVRHQGFIPWDDDMDFGVSSEFFPRLLEALSLELPEYYKVRTIKNCDLFYVNFIKIEDTRTLINEVGKSECNDKIGIFLDIFPLYRTNSKKSIFSLNSIIVKLVTLQAIIFTDTSQRKGMKKKIASIAKTIYPFSRFTIHKLIDYLFKLREHHGKRNDCICNFYGAWGLKELISAKIIGNPKEYKFENITLSGVENSDAYLKSLYNNYMELPPVEKRRIHLKEMFFVSKDHI